MTRIINEYATALFMVARENSCEQKFADALTLISDMIKEFPEYTEFLSSPSIPLDERLVSIDKAFSDAVPEYVLSFMKLLCENGHISEYNECYMEYMALHNEFNRIVTAKVVSAIELTEAEKLAIKDKLEKKKGFEVVLNCTVDPKLVGGLFVEIDGEVIDTSLNRRLKEIKDVIYK